VHRNRLTARQPPTSRGLARTLAAFAQLLVGGNASARDQFVREGGVKALVDLLGAPSVANDAAFASAICTALQVFPIGPLPSPLTMRPSRPSAYRNPSSFFRHNNSFSMRKALRAFTLSHAHPLPFPLAPLASARPSLGRAAEAAATPSAAATTWPKSPLPATRHARSAAVATTTAARRCVVRAQPCHFAFQ